jgi:hypothetical protein
MEDSMLPKWIKVNQVEKTAAINIEGFPLSEDTKNWPDEILDHVQNKYPFIKGYPTILKVEKRDQETNSAIMYIIVQISEGVKLSIVVMVSSGKLLPIFPFIYNGKFYPLIEEAVNDIMSGASSIGTLTDEKIPIGKTPWHFMLEFLQNMMINKRASIASHIEKTQDLNAIEALMGDEKIAKMMTTLVSKPELRSVKTASVRNGVYQEIVNGKIVKTERISEKTHMTSKHMKLAEVNEAIANDKEIIVHSVNRMGKLAGRIIKGENSAPILEGETYKINLGDAGVVNAKYIRDIYESDFKEKKKEDDNVPIATALPSDPAKNTEVKTNVYENDMYQIFWNKDKGFFLLKRVELLPLAEDKISDGPETHEIGDADIGKYIFKVTGDKKDYIDNPGYLFTIVDDDKEKTFHFRSNKNSKWGTKIIYSPAFNDKDDHRLGDRLIGEPLKGFSVNVIGLPKYSILEKTASEKMGAYIRLEKIDTTDSMEKYSLMLQVSGTSKASFIFGGLDSLGITQENDDNVNGKTTEGDRGVVEHELVRAGIEKDSIDQLFNEADKEGSATMFIPTEKLIPEENVTEPAMKTAKAINKTVDEYLSFNKIAVLMSSKDRSISDIFSLHFLTPENVTAFLEEIPKLEGIVDHLCRYYIYRNVGLESTTDRVDNRKLEDVIRGLYLVISDLKKYMFLFRNNEIGKGKTE